MPDLKIIKDNSTASDRIRAEVARVAAELAETNAETAESNAKASEDQAMAAVNALSFVTFNRGFSGDDDLTVVPTTTGAEENDISWYLDNNSLQIIRLESGSWEDFGEPITTKKYVDDKASLWGVGEAGLNKNIKANDKYFNNYRVPTLEVVDPFVRGMRILWADGDLLYAESKTTLYKSTDSGITWSVAGWKNQQFAIFNFFYVASNGNLITCISGGNTVQVSTDDGASWSNSLDLTETEADRMLGPQSITEDEANGDLYLVNYGNDPTIKGIIYKSTDGGENWTHFHEMFNENFRHWHTCHYDPIDQTVYFCGGDSGDEAGIYRLNAGKTDIEPVILNQDMPEWNMGARAIGLMFFPDYIAWGADVTNDPNIYRLERSSIGGALNYERVGIMNSQAWWSQLASDDYTMWIQQSADFSGIDESTHLYLLENNAADIYELGSIDADSGGSVGQINAPGAMLKSGGKEFWLQGLFSNTAKQFNGKFTIAKGTRDLRPLQEDKKKYTSPISISGRHDWSGESKFTIGTFEMGTRVASLRVLEAGVEKIGGGGRRMEIYNRTQDVQLIQFDDRNIRELQNNYDAALAYFRKGVDSITDFDIIDINLLRVSTEDYTVGHVVVELGV